MQYFYFNNKMTLRFIIYVLKFMFYYDFSFYCDFTEPNLNTINKNDIKK